MNLSGDQTRESDLSSRQCFPGCRVRQEVSLSDPGAQSRYVAPMEWWVLAWQWTGSRDTTSRSRCPVEPRSSAGSHVPSTISGTGIGVMFTLEPTDRDALKVPK